MKIKILGTCYKIKHLKKPTQYMKDNNSVGLADYDKQEIIIITEHFGGDIEDYEEEVVRSKNSIKDTLYHELAHVYLNESGQDDINNERIVEVMSKFAKFIEKEIISKKVGE